MSGRPKGIPKTGGRKAGTPNKITQTLTDAIDTAFAELGGAEYLKSVANTNAQAFMALLGRRLPKDLNLNASGSVIFQIVTGVPPDSSNH